MPADDLSAAQDGEAWILPVGVVIADHKSDAADRRIEDLDAGVPGREHFLILWIESILAVFADDAVRAQQHGGVIGEAGFRVPLRDADAQVHPMPRENWQQSGGGLAGDRIQVRRDLRRVAEQIAADRRFRKYRVIYPKLACFLSRVCEAIDVPIQIAPSGHKIHRRDFDRLRQSYNRGESQDQ